MIISRRKYERDIDEAYEKGCRETEQRFWQNEEFRRLHERCSELAESIRKLEGKPAAIDELKALYPK
jgi:hypothetical protein